MHEKRINAAYLSSCDPGKAYDWLKERQPICKPGYDKPWKAEAAKVLEYILLRRRDPLIDLAIAKFGQSHIALRRVFRRGNIGVRCAVLSNPYFPSEIGIGPSALSDEEIADLVRNGSNAELWAYASNPFLDNNTYVSMISKEGVFEALDDAGYMRLLVVLSENPRLSARLDDTYMDGYAEYDYGRVSNAAWGLAHSLPTTTAWAHILSVLLEKTSIPVGFKNVGEALERWRFESRGDNDKSWFEQGTSFLLRLRLADALEPNDELLNSEDLALRMSFYKRFPWYRYDDWPSFLERDGENFIEAALGNMGLWRDPEQRERLRQATWDCPDPKSEMMAPNSYRAKEAFLAEENPDWFLDEDERIESNPAKAIHRLESRLKGIEDSISELLDSRVLNKIL